MQPGKGLFSLNIIHKAMLAGQVLFTGVAFFMIWQGLQEPAMKEEEKIFQVISIALAAVGVFAGSALFKKKLLEIRSMTGSNKEKFAAYRSACIMQWALLEGPCLFCIISFFLIGNYAFLALAGVLIILFAILSPNKNKVALQLGLSVEEVEEL